MNRWAPLLLLYALMNIGLAHANPGTQDYEELDPIEGFNRAMFSFNEQADKYVLKPVAQAYKFVTPDIVNTGITNFFNNLDEVGTFVNSLLQAKFHNATVTLNRIIYNTTFGLGGFFDVATVFGLHNDEEDFGQTLAVWGYENSSYLVLPFLGPTTVRDGTARFVDAYFDPLMHIEHVHRDERLIATGVNIVDKRADLLGGENLFVGTDTYRFVRSAYYQNREFVIKDGEVSDPFADDDFERYEDF